jgi:guanylate kinase
MTDRENTAALYSFESPPLLVVISGPSGAGKDEVIQLMKESGSPFHFVVTAPSGRMRKRVWTIILFP